MSFSAGSGATISVGTLSASFVLNATAATSAISGIQTQTTNLKNSFNQTFNLKIDSSQAVSNINKATSALDTFKRGLEFGAGLLSFGLIDKAIKGIGDAAIGMNAKLQQSQTAFTALTGSAQTASNLVQSLETLASHSTFGLAQLQGAAQQMIAFGVATSNVPPLIQAVQNAAAASGGDINDKFSRISYVISELSSGMKLSERQLRQLAQAGVPLTAIAQQLGITVEQLQNAGKTGEVTSAQVVAAFQKVYTSGNLGDFMSKQAQTFSGAMNLIRTNLSLAGATAFKPLFDTISNLAVKFALFAQTPTFNQWVSQIQHGVAVVVASLKELATVLGPIGSALAKVFGLNTGGIAAEMEAVKNAHVDVGTYDASLQGVNTTLDNSKAKQAEYKKTIDDAALAIVGLNDQLAANKVLLDQNASAIAAVKNQYDPIIRNATQQIHDINVLTPDELSRKQRELELDKEKANLELTRPDVSGFDAQILSDQTALADMPRLDTSKWDTAISAYDAQIQSLQDSISNLNTDEFDRKINAIRDKLAEPPPNTQGLSNAMSALEAQLAGGQISQADFNSQYGALSRQKQGILGKYQSDTTGLQGQLKLLEQQRRDQALSNEETRKSDEARITNLRRLADEQKKERSDAEAADRASRQRLEDDIRKETNLRAQALAPYEAAMKKITDEQEQNRLKDAAASAQRAIDLAPWQAALDKARESEDAALAPLMEQKQSLDDIRTKLQEQKTELENTKASAEANARALKDSAAGAGELATNMGKVADAIPDDSRWGAFKDSAAGEDSPFVSFLKSVNTHLRDLRDIIANDVAPAITRFSDWFKGDGVNGVKDLYHWLNDNFTPSLRDLWRVLSTDLPPVLGDLSHIVGAVLTLDFKVWKQAIDDLVAPTLRLLIDIMTNQLHNELTLLHTILDGDVFNAIGKVTDKFGDFVTELKGDQGVLGALGSVLDWVRQNWDGLSEMLSHPFTSALGGVRDFFGTLGKGINWLADHFKLPSISSWDGGGNDSAAPPAPTGGGNPARGYARGVTNSPRPGHWAIVGEEGPEPMWVPPGATIVPNDTAAAMGMLPGHADGLNLGFLDDLFSSVGGVLTGTASRFADALVDKLPSFDVPGVPGAGTALLGQLRGGLGSWLATSPMNLVQSIVSGVTGALGGGANLPGMNATAGSGNWHNPVPGFRAVQGSWTHGGTHDNEAAVDWATPLGTTILAPDSGLAYTVWNGDGATGRTGVINHGNGWVTYYGHVRDFADGGIGQDQPVGHTGSPEEDGGAGSGAHLHFAMRLNGAYERPEDYIPGIFGLKDGGYFPAHDPRLAVIGEGANDEIAAPVPMLRQVLRDVIRTEGGTTVAVAPGAVTINVPPGESGRRAGLDAWDAFAGELARKGVVLR